MRDTIENRLEAGARNLLVNCGDCRPNQHLLIVYEMETDGYYDPALVKVLKEAADRLGMKTSLHGVPFAKDVEDPDEALSAKMDLADCTVFLARLGDQIRFRERPKQSSQIVSYALDASMLSSSFGTTNYNAFESLKHLITQAFMTAKDVRVTCPAGTDFRGSCTSLGAAPSDVSCKRFPVSIFAPIPASGFTGHIAQTGFLTGTGSHFYAPYNCPLNETLKINFEKSYITGFEGSDRDVAAARAHYERVGNTFGIDTYFVHSWHVGIHPGCHYTAPAARNIERWGGVAFGNPRLLHFHTCGAFAPGEISLNVVDPTVILDGEALWENGVLHPERLPAGAALLEQFPEMVEVFAHPENEVGLSPCGRLTFE